MINTLLRDHSVDLDVEDTINRIEAWLDPPSYYQRFDAATKTRLADTCQWLFSIPKFINWLEVDSSNSSGRILCVTGRSSCVTGTDNGILIAPTGNPGCGKTVLAASAVDSIRSASPESGNNGAGLCCYYFFSQVDSISNPSISAYRAILSQILRQQQADLSTIDTFSFAMTSVHTSRSATSTDLLTLLRVILAGIPRLKIVIDGFDECDDTIELLEFLEELTVNTTTKILIFSRPNVEVLRDSISKDHKIHISSTSSKGDIQLFFASRLEPFFRRGKIPSSCDQAAIIRHLVRVCNGMFMWAWLTIKYLSSPALTPSERIDTIWNIQLPEGLDVMYERIFRLLERSPKPEKDLARRIFRWLIYAREIISINQLYDVSSTTAGVLARPGASKEYEDAIILSCGGLVEVSFKYCHFIHLSIKEFLLSNHPSVVDFMQSVAQSALDIAVVCVKYLIVKTPREPLSGTLGVASSAKYVDEKYPFLLYASVYWLQHVYDATICYTKPPYNSVPDLDPLCDLLSAMDDFLDSKLKILAWIECIYVRRSLDSGIADLRLWARYGSKQISMGKRSDLVLLSRKALLLSHDLAALDTAWGSVLTETPNEIWGDVTAFTKSSFWQSTKATEVRSLAAISPFKRSVSKNLLFTASQLSSSGLELGVLSIWPSK
jgi:hypothetical protein